MHTLTQNIRTRTSELCCRRTVAALEKHEFTAVYCATAADAAAHILNAASEATSVGFGGSMSVQGLDIEATLAARGVEILNHGDPALPIEEKIAIMRRQQTCDLFVCGVNALTTSGEIVNIDGVGNRVAATLFGPRRTILVAGRNKIVHGDSADAIRRVKAESSPQNCVRLDKNTPCAKTGICANCDVPDRICRITVILDRKPSRSDVIVLVVNEDMGF